MSDNGDSGKYRLHTTKCCLGVHNLCPDAYLQCLFMAIDDDRLMPIDCPVITCHQPCVLPDPEAASYEHPDRLYQRVRLFVDTRYDHIRYEPVSEETVARYMHKYECLYSAWEEGATRIRLAVEAKLRCFTDQRVSPCCGIPYFYDACSAVECGSCPFYLCRICHKMYQSKQDCHIHVFECVRVHALLHNVDEDNMNDIFVSERDQETYFRMTRVRMIYEYARNRDRSILKDTPDVGGIRWNTLVPYVLRTMLCSGSTNRRVIDELGITDGILSLSHV